MIFIGTVRDNYYNRTEFLNFFQKHLHLHIFQNVFGSEMMSLFAQARIVLNHPINNDLNYRVFEALSSGSMLLTPRTGNGLTDIFSDGEDLVTFDAHNRMDGVRKARYYLKHEKARERIAESGYRKVIKNHSRLERARQIAAFIKDNPVSRKRCQAAMYKDLGNAYYVIDQLIFSFSNKPRYEGEARRCSQAVLREYIKRKPRDPEGHYLLGMCLCADNWFDEACLVMEKAIKIDSQYTAAYIGLGILALRRGDNGNAIDHFQSAFNTDDKSARTSLEKIYLSRPNVFWGYVNLGHIFLSVGLIGEAISYFEQALALEESDPDLLASLGCAYVKSKNKQRARYYFQKALEMDPSNLRIAQILEKTCDDL